MNKNKRGLVFEIIIMLIVIIISIPIYKTYSNIAINNREYASIYNNPLKIELAKENIENNNVNDNIIKITNYTNKSIDYRIILKMTKVSDINNYSIIFNGKEENLSKLNYKEDKEYNYFYLDKFNIGNKDQYMSFTIIPKENTKEIIRYNFLTEELSKGEL